VSLTPGGTTDSSIARGTSIAPPKVCFGAFDSGADQALPQVAAAADRFGQRRGDLVELLAAKHEPEEDGDQHDQNPEERAGEKEHPGGLEESRPGESSSATVRPL